MNTSRANRRTQILQPEKHQFSRGLLLIPLLESFVQFVSNNKFKGYVFNLAEGITHFSFGPEVVIAQRLCVSPPSTSTIYIIKLDGDKLLNLCCSFM